MLLNKIGKLINRFGFHVSRKFRVRLDNINLLELGILKILHNYEKINFVQIGASDGVTNDPLHPIINAHKERISGVCVEPLPGPYAQLVQNYQEYKNIKTINAAIAENDGQLSFFVPIKEKEAYFSKKSSLSASNLLKHGLRKSEIRKIEVQSMSVSTLLKKIDINHVHVLVIDVEGYDFKVLNSFFKNGVFPEVVLFEHAHLPRQERELVRHLFGKYKYKFIEATMDTLAIKQQIK